MAENESEINVEGSEERCIGVSNQVAGVGDTQEQVDVGEGTQQQGDVGEEELTEVAGNSEDTVTAPHEISSPSAAAEEATSSPTATSSSPATTSSSPPATTPTSSTATKSLEKVEVLLKPVGDAPMLKKKKWAVDPNKSVGGIIDFIRKCLRFGEGETLFVYVNQCFAPAPDVDVKTLYNCFGSDGKLVLNYCKSTAWG